MKKALIAIIVLFIICGVVYIGFHSYFNNEDKQLIAAVKLMEISEAKLEKFEITYDQYKEITAPLLYEGFTNKENEDIFGYKGKMFKGKDLAGLSHEEILEMKKELGESTQKIFGESKIESIQISNVYDDKTLDGKIIYTKKVVRFTKMPDMDMVEYKKYLFTRINSKWKIMDVISKPFTMEQLNTEETKPYETYDGKKIDYKEIELN